MLQTLFNYFRQRRDRELCYMTGYIQMYKKLCRTGYKATMLEEMLYREAVEHLEKNSKTALD